MNYPTYDQQPVVIEDGLARPAHADDVDVAALDLADVRAVRDDAVRTHYLSTDDFAAAAGDLQIALLSLLAAEKAFTDRGIPEFANAAAGLRAQTAFLLNTAHG